jgi:Zn-dependent protease
LIFALLTWTLAASYYPAEFKNWPVAQYWIVGAATAILMFVSVLLHELGHSVVAMRYKIPVRSITLFIFGGVAQIGAEPGPRFENNYRAVKARVNTMPHTPHVEKHFTGNQAIRDIVIGMREVGREWPPRSLTE